MKVEEMQEEEEEGGEERIKENKLLFASYIIYFLELGLLLPLAPPPLGLASGMLKPITTTETLSIEERRRALSTSSEAALRTSLCTKSLLLTKLIAC